MISAEIKSENDGLDDFIKESREFDKRVAIVTLNYQ
jgi:hypothetical protein